MALLGGTTESYNLATGIREDLEDTIWDLFPLDTYCLTNFDRVDASDTFHEWQSDSLAGATSNRQLEGDDATFLTVSGPVRMGNYCQISRKTFLISGTMEAVNLAGRRSEIVRQGMKQMKELKREHSRALAA